MERLIFCKHSVFYLVLFLLFLNVKVVNASDLITHDIINPQIVMQCFIPFKIAASICNINIYDALAYEWTVDVKIKREGYTYFEETVSGVFLGNGSASNPTCTTIETVNEFFPEVEGTYTVEVDVNYIYDIDPSNDKLTREFTVECLFGSIRGQKFEDYNENATKDTNEVGIDGVEIKLYDDQGIFLKIDTTYSEDLNGDNRIDPMTESGLFLFDSLDAGNYELEEVVPLGWSQTFPLANGAHLINLPLGFDLDGILFGNSSDESYDYGDLPDPFDPDNPCGFNQCYPTLWPLGPRHPNIGPKIGDLRDAEDDGQPALCADEDDWFWFFGIDDEEGVEFIKYNVNDSGEVKIKVTGNPSDFPAYLSGWIDFNGDRFMTSGWMGPNEQIVAAVIAAQGIYTFKFKIPEDAIEGIYSRFRISTSWLSVVFSFGVALDGEVEDHAVFGLDFGDANEEGDSNAIIFPYGYPVKTTSNGARHIISPLKRLGDEDTDYDLNGMPSYFSNGDDNEKDADENGILYGEEFYIHYDGPDPDYEVRHMTIYGMAPGSNVSITPLATQTGLFNMWVDWNRDGDWADLGEQVFDDEVILSGPTYTELNFDVPQDAELGYTYARYRISTRPGLEFTGGAPDGEVEDHILMIGTEVGIQYDQNDLPTEFELYQNYPNPFNPTTSIQFALPIRSKVTLKIFNTLGQTMEELLNNSIEAGIHKVDWNAEDMPSGVYYYRINVLPEDGGAEFIKVGKMILIR